MLYFTYCWSCHFAICYNIFGSLSTIITQEVFLSESDHTNKARTGSLKILVGKCGGNTKRRQSCLPCLVDAVHGGTIDNLVCRGCSDVMPRDDTPRDNMPRDDTSPKTLCPGDDMPRRRYAPETLCPRDMMQGRSWVCPGQT